MNPIQSFHSKLRGLAAVLDGETARLTRALDGEDSGEGAGGRARLSVGGGPCQGGRKRAVLCRCDPG